MNKPSRRAVVRTGVWAVPAVATVAAAPAFAIQSGGTPPVEVTGVLDGCKFPGHSSHDENTWYGYKFVIGFHNTTAGSATVGITCDSLTISGADTTEISPCPESFVVGAGQTVPRTYTVQSENSAQRTATLTYTVSNSDGTQSYTAALTWSDFPPCQSHPID